MESVFLTVMELAAAAPYVAALFGLVVGSFLNVVIYRLPIILERQWHEQLADTPPGLTTSPPAETFSLVVPRSRCPHCGHRISAFENIPVLSYLWLRGRCSACATPIGIRYPAIEMLTAVLSFMVAWRFGPTMATVSALFLTWSLIALAFIDHDTMLLPDDITLPLLWLGLLVNVAGIHSPLPSAVIGAAAGYLSLWAIFHAFRLATGKEGMGYGDFKLLAALGAWMGWQMLPAIVLVSSFVGAVLGLFLIVAHGRDRSRPIPFGPFLCVAGWIALMWGNELNHLYFATWR